MSYQILVKGKAVDEASETLRHIAHAILRDYPEGTEAHRLRCSIDRSDWASVIGYEFDYHGNWSLNELIDVRQTVALFQKNDAVVDLGIDKAEVALTKFILADNICKQTNQIITAFENGDFCFMSPLVAPVLHEAAKRISNVLGDVPKLSELRVKFGKGATVSTKKRYASVRRKLSADVHCSPSLVPYLPAIAEAFPHLLRGTASEDDDESSEYVTELLDVTVCYAKVGFARKNVKTHRTTVTEPDMNMLLQLGYGEDVRGKLLKRAGIDITDQTVNQRKAREGSITGEIATLDLVSASDLQARLLVRFLTPLQWWRVLDDISSRTVVLPDGTLRTLSMISSMGNGVTFPLETLIFWGITAACVDLLGGNPDDVSVYGDDITCPVTYVPKILEVFRGVGFQVNETKSYWTGPFRESCGKDYYCGIDIRPAYVKGEEPVTVLSLFSLHNHFIAQHRDDLAAAVLECIPDPYKLFGPPCYGDGHLHSRNWRGKSHKRDAGWAGYIFDTYSLKGPKDTDCLPGDYVYPLYSTYIREDLSAVEKAVQPSHGARLYGARMRSNSYLRLKKLKEDARSYVDEDDTAQESHQLRLKGKKGREVNWLWNTSLPLSELPQVNKISIYTLLVPPVIL